MGGASGQCVVGHKGQVKGCIYNKGKRDNPEKRRGIYTQEVWRWDVGTHLKDIQSHRQRLQGPQHVHGHLFILGTRATRERNVKGGSKDREESVD